LSHYRNFSLFRCRSHNTGRASQGSFRFAVPASLPPLPK